MTTKSVRKRDREFPVATHELDLSRPHVPATEIQAVMEAAAGDEPAVSAEEMLHLKDALADAIDALQEPHRTVFMAIVMERKSVREVAAWYATGTSQQEVSAAVKRYKTRVHRWYREAIQELQEVLGNDPAVRRHLGLDPDDVG